MERFKQTNDVVSFKVFVVVVVVFLPVLLSYFVTSLTPAFSHN